MMLKNLFNFIVSSYKYVRSYLPSSLPVGVTEMEAWTKEVVELSGLPYNDSLKFAAMSMIPHTIQPQIDLTKRSWYTKRWFAICLRKFASNQVAITMMGDMKEVQKKQIEAAKAAADKIAAANAVQPPVATVTPIKSAPTVSTDGPKVS